MEKLSVSINDLVCSGSWNPIFISNNGPNLSHLLFENNVILISRVKSQIKVIVTLMDNFSRASSLKTNLAKSCAFYSSGIPQTKINQLTTILGI